MRARRTTGESTDNPTASVTDSQSQETQRRVVPIEEAIRRIGDKKYIHTFMNSAFVLLGADHDREDLITAMRTHGVEEAGEGATGLGHPLVIVNYPLGEGRVTPLFIEAALAEAKANR